MPAMPGPRSGVRSWGAPPVTSPDPVAPAVSAEAPAGDDAADGTGAAAVEAPPADGSTAEPSTPVVPFVAPVVPGGDWLATVCPYLTSADGSYRSAEPDEGHRCVAVDPPATLPLAFQERFCLTDRHPRCEMYKYAQEVGQHGGIPVPVDQLESAATRPVRGAGSDDGIPRDRRTLIAAGSVGGVVLLLVILALLMGSCSGGGGGTPTGSADPGASEAAGATPTPAPTPTPTPTPTPASSLDVEASPAVGENTTGSFTVLYVIQPGEGLKKVAETFGITRKRILRANPELEEVTPAEMPGMTIEVPVPADMDQAELEALPGYQEANT